MATYYLPFLFESLHLTCHFIKYYATTKKYFGWQASLINWGPPKIYLSPNIHYVENDF